MHWYCCPRYDGTLVLIFPLHICAFHQIRNISSTGLFMILMKSSTRVFLRSDHYVVVMWPPRSNMIMLPRFGFNLMVHYCWSMRGWNSILQRKCNANATQHLLIFYIFSATYVTSTSLECNVDKFASIQPKQNRWPWNML
jgi:hypothetical protein